MTTGTEPRADLGDSASPALLSGRVIAGVAALGALAVLVFTRVTHAPVGTDGVCYLAVADHLVAGKGLGFWLEDPLVTWPPLWPAMIAVVRWATGWRADVSAVVLNAGLIAVLAAEVGWLLRRLRVRRAVATGALAVAILSPVTVVLAGVVQTEVVFAVLAMAAVIGALRYRDGDGVAWFVLAVAATSAGFFTRYAGLYLIPLIAAWLLVPRPASGSLHPRRWHWWPAITYGVVAGAAPVGWMLRNHHVSGTYLGPRFPSGVGPVRNLAEAFTGMSKFVLGTRELPTGPGALFGALLLAAGLWLVLPLILDGTPWRQWLTPLVAAATSATGLVTVVAAGSVAALVWSRSQYAFDNLDVRLLFPSLMMGVIVAAMAVDRGLGLVVEGWPRFDAALRKSVAPLGRAVLVVWVVLQLGLTVAVLGPVNSSFTDKGFNAPRSIELGKSPLWEQLPEGCELWSNNSFDLYRSGIEAMMSARRYEWQSSTPTGDLDRLRRDVLGGRDICLAWVHYTDDENFLAPDDLPSGVQITKIGRDGELTLYRYRPA